MVVGLGNPGKEYVGTPHNVGFDVVENLLGMLPSATWKTWRKAEVASGFLVGKKGVDSEEAEQRALLVKPRTYMNLSGEAVREVLGFHKIPSKNWLVVLDDIELPPGKLRSREKGSDGGHRGLRSLIQCLGTQDFQRLRIGVGRPEGKMGVKSHVLRPFASSQIREKIEEGTREATNRALRFLQDGYFINWSS